MKKRGAESWTSPDPALRCAIVTVNVPPGPAHGLGKLDVEDPQNPHPRRRSEQTAPLDPLLLAEERYRPLSGEV